MKIIFLIHVLAIDDLQQEQCRCSFYLMPRTIIHNTSHNMLKKYFPVPEEGRTTLTQMCLQKQQWSYQNKETLYL